MAISICPHPNPPTCEYVTLYREFVGLIKLRISTKIILEFPIDLKCTHEEDPFKRTAKSMKKM